MATNKHGAKVGDIYVGSWGYDQTNVDAWQVTRTMPASVEITKIALEQVGHRVRPVRREFCDAGLPGWAQLVKRTNTGNAYVRITSYLYAYLWDGESTFHETYAAGGMGH